jgi:hypothetical protein
MALLFSPAFWTMAALVISFLVLLVTRHGPRYGARPLGR